MTPGARPPAVRIRRGTPADASALTELHLDVWDEAYAGLMPRRILDERRRRRDHLVTGWTDILSEPEPVWLAEDPTETGDGSARLVGFSWAGQDDEEGVPADVELKVLALYVRANHYGTGLGHALLTAAIGDRAAYLWVLAANHRAIGFYERHGFRLDGTQDQRDEGLHVRMVRAGT